MFDAVRVDLERARASSNPSRLQSQLDRQSKLARKVRAQAAVASPHALLWKILAGFACVLLLSAVAHKSNGGRRGLDGASTLPYNALDGGDVGATWTTQRLCRHFGVPVPSRVRVEHGVDTLAKLDDATARWSEIHLVQLDVAYRAAGDDEKSARGWRAALTRAPRAFPSSPRPPTARPISPSTRFWTRSPAASSRSASPSDANRASCSPSRTRAPSHPPCAPSAIACAPDASPARSSSAARFSRAGWISAPTRVGVRVAPGARNQPRPRRERTSRVRTARSGGRVRGVARRARTTHVSVLAV